MTPKPRPDTNRYPDVPVGPRLEAVLNLGYRARRPVLLEGPTGIGKSEVVRAVADKLGLATVVLDLSLLEPPDLVGLPKLEDGVTRYAAPAILPRDGAGILLLEELNRAERYMQQPALQLLSARRLHEYVLPDGWVCFAAINPESGEYHVTPLDRALRARFLHVTVRADRASWLAWASHANVHSAVVDLVRTHERALEEVPPRTWTYVSHVLAAMSERELRDEALLRDAVGGYVPAVWCEALLATRSSWSQSLEVDVRDVLASYAPGGAASIVVKRYRDAGQTDRLEELVQRILSVVRGPEIAVLAEDGRFRMEAFEALLADLPGDQREKLQEALGKNPVAVVLLGVAPEDFLVAAPGTATVQKLRTWCSDPLQQHKAILAATAIKSHLEQHSQLVELRRNNRARAGLGIVLSHLGERFGVSLVDSLLKLGITPVRPAT
jgi:MoxR-like ATPase